MEIAFCLFCLNSYNEIYESQATVFSILYRLFHSLYIFNQHKDSEMVAYWIEILEKLIIMKLYKFELLFFGGTVLTGNSALVCR